jgi:3-hydroxyacyl-[acyl-carrier-protein] dehydratase
MTLKTLSETEIIDYIPQRYPFRFVDEILHVDPEGISGQYTFKSDEWFYPGHFPGNPITPGVILTEAQGQIGLVGFGFYLLSMSHPRKILLEYNILLIELHSEYFREVKPNDTVITQAMKIEYRRNKLHVAMKMMDTNNKLIAESKGYGLIVRTSDLAIK